jgi:hypothetical protein
MKQRALFMATKKLLQRTPGALHDDGGGNGNAYGDGDTDVSDSDRRHLHSIHALAEEIDMPVDEVAAAYEDILDELEDDAQVKDYLPILVSKRVKRLYRSHH